ncbi:shikimate O-hydroxycinnamoyltransferase-like [Sesamum indicum]|uniref:Shikimate O-hydroxycinnamoyltransferase-like n=1 Tax=Sesamum indicum TaxID=4182 RepID=A0A6I9T4M3_SESIN|nr:shikimate O-hydroxycinnamoyltransferase-like [Sesamum indicum]
MRTKFEMAALSPNPAMQDLKLTFQLSTLVFPAQQTDDHKTLFLSNIDQSLNFNVQILYFFSPNPDFPPDTVVTRLKLAVEKVLVPYDFMAGRLKWNHHSARLDLHCNAAGAGFMAASSTFSLDEIGDLVCPNPGFRQLVVQTLNNLEDEDQPLCVFQVTSFKCGGFAIGVSLNHILLDGLAGRMFLENLASQAFEDKPLAIIPCHNRRLLAARSPPLISFPHPELLKPQFPVLGRPVSGSEKELDFKVFKISSSDVNFLKAMVAKQAAADNATAVKITSFNVMAALIWRCRALSLCDVEGNKDRVFTMCYAVDLRSRLNPPLPPEYCGNAILPAYASAKCRDIEKWPLLKLVEMISEGIERLSDEYVKSAIDWLEINKGIPYGDCVLTSWLRLGLNEVVFPWGKSLYCCHVVNNLERLCWMFPYVDGVNILIQRPAEEMERFQFHLLNLIVA